MTDTQTKPPPPAAFTLAAPRSAPKTGMPTEGLWLIAGLPKCGKTTLAASAEGAIVLELERGGADRVDGWVQEIPDLATFRAAVKAVTKEPKARIVVVDTIDVVLGWLEDDVAAKFGLETVSDRKEGVNSFAVWGELRKKVEDLIGYFKVMGKLVVLISHYKEPKLDADGKLVIPPGINAPGKIGSYICAQADAIGHAYKRPAGQRMEHILSFVGGPLGTWGSRIRELEDKTIVLPRTEPWTAVEAAFVPAKLAAKTVNGTKAVKAGRSK